MRFFIVAICSVFCLISYGNDVVTTKILNNSTAQGVADIQAQRNSMGHIGGNRGKREGVGFSRISARQAISNCCYWGQLTPVDIGVTQSKYGWYACVRYK